MFQLLLIAFWGQCAQAGVITPAAPGVTARAILPRDSTVVGYASTGFEDGTILWDTITAAEGSTLATSGTQVAVCPTDGCNWFQCSAEYAVFETGTPIYCGGLSSSTCSYNRIYTDIHDSSPLTNYWCDAVGVTGLEIYETTPTDGPTSTPGITTTTSRLTPTTTSSSTSPTTPVPKPTDPVPNNKKSVPIGAIVGGVIGGIAVIGAIIVAVVILMRRKKSTPPPQPPPQNQQYYPPQNPQNPQNQGYFGGAPLPEKTPAATAAMQPYYGESGPASPVPQYTPGSPPPQAISPAPPMSPVPQYTPHNSNMNELPAGRM